MNDFGIIFKGPFRGPSGYSNYGRGLLDALLTHTDVPVRIQFMNYWGNLSGALSPEWEQKLNKLGATELPKKTVRLQLNVPDRFQLEVQDAFNVGITMFETNRIPDPWVAKCNAMDFVYVPSKYCLETFIAGGVDKEKIGLLPPVFSKDVFSPAAGSLNFESVDGKNEVGRSGFRILTNADWTERKNVKMLIRLYFSLFGAKDNVQLLLKVYHGGNTERHREEIYRKVIAVRDEMGLKVTPPVLLLCDMLKEFEISKLYNSVDLYASLHRGEGIGLPPMEAGMCGVPSLLTNATGVTDYLSEDTGYPVKVSGWTEVDKTMEKITPNYRGMLWPEPDYQSAASLLTAAYRNSDRRKGKGMNMREFLLRHSNPASVAVKLVRDIGKRIR